MDKVPMLCRTIIMMFVTMMRMTLMCGGFKKIMNWFKKKDNELV